MNVGDELEGALKAYDYDRAGGWLVRIETDGRGGLIETPVRPLRADEIIGAQRELEPDGWTVETIDQAEHLIALRGPLAAHEVAAALGLDRPSVGYALVALVQQGRATRGKPSSTAAVEYRSRNGNGKG